MNQLNITVPTLFGLESVVGFEARRLGAENVTLSDGKVEFTGDLSTVAKANLWLRCGERVLLTLAKFPARSFEELFQGVKAIPWEEFLAKEDAFPVKGHALNSQLHSVPDCQSVIKKACVERLKQHYGISWFPESGSLHSIQFSIRNDQAAIMLDTSGSGLHKRGYRKNALGAPIKETLAAGILDLARVGKETVLCDPFCGSGTFLIEGALRALNIAPGLNRRFACEQWGLFDEAIFRQARQEALDAIDKSAPFRAYGYDLDEEAVALSLQNLKKAGVGSRVQVQRRDVREFAPPCEGPVTIVTNPPYGERLLEREEAQELYRAIGPLFSRPSLKTYLITPEEDFESLFGRPADKRRKLYNGMIRCQLYMYWK